MHIPAKLRAFAKQADAQTWLTALPATVALLARKWNLKVGDAYASCGVSYAAPATQVDQAGQPVVLKVQWPHEECRFEADALKAWGGHGAVALLASDAQHHAMLLERCEPGQHLAATPNIDAIGVMIELLPQLWITTRHPFKLLRDEALSWQASLHAGWQANPASCDKALVDAACAMINELADSQGQQVLVHQDLHGDNVLAATRSPWLAIDPKPLVGEREFGLSPIIRSVEFGATKTDLLYRLDRLTEAFSLDRKRVCGWALAQAMAWSFSSENAAQQHQLARWLLATR